MRLTLITFFFFSTLAVKAQKQECWECLAAARNLNSNIALERCIQIEKKQQLETNEREVISFVIGKLLLMEGKPEAALNYLNVSAKSTDSLFKSLSLGLLGDYYLDKNKPDLALDYYLKASELANNSLYTPYFLNKQGIVFQIQNKEEDFERIGSRLRVNHIQFFNALYLGDRYGRKPSKYDASNRLLLDHRLPAGPYGIGMVNGTQVEKAIFDVRLQSVEQVYESYPSYNMDVPPQYVMDEMAWEVSLNATLLRINEIAFALKANEREFQAYIFGENSYSLLPEINQAFTSGGVFNKAELVRYISDQENTTDPETKAGWANTKRALLEQISLEKYKYLLSLGLYVSTNEAMLADKASKKIIQIKGVCFPRDYFSGSSFSVSEKELQTYFEFHKADPHYDYSAMRKMKFFKFPIALGKADSIAFEKELNELKSAFEKTASDSLFVAEHSDYPRAYASGNLGTAFPASNERAREFFTYPDELEDRMKTAKIGEVVGPYIDKKAFRLVKVVAFNEKLLTVRHILISSNKEAFSAERHESKRKFALDLMGKINHDNFGEYVRKYSEDPGSRDKGGVYTDFMDYEMVTPFADFAVNEPIGKIGIVETAFGFHIMEVLDRKPTKFPVVAIVERKLVPDEKIQQAIGVEVSKLFALMNREMESLTPDRKKAYFDSVAGIYGDPGQININEFYPAMTYFAKQETNDRMMEYAYRKNVPSNQLMTPIKDSTDWIFPFFEAAYSGADYNQKQVLEFLKGNYQDDKILDSLQSTFGELSSVEEIAKQAKLNVFIEEISVDPKIITEQISFDFVQNLLTERNPKPGIQWFHSYSRCFAYELVSTRNAMPLTDYSTLQTSLQGKLMDDLNDLIKFNTSLTKKTVYNYPLFKLMLRQ